MINLAGQLHFFIRAAIDLDIGRIMGFVIDRAILTKIDITIGFFELFLW